jgi:hypothetical protein
MTTCQIRLISESELRRSWGIRAEPAAAAAVAAAPTAPSTAVATPDTNDHNIDEDDDDDVQILEVVSPASARRRREAEAALKNQFYNYTDEEVLILQHYLPPDELADLITETWDATTPTYLTHRFE